MRYFYYTWVKELSHGSKEIKLHHNLISSIRHSSIKDEKEEDEDDEDEKDEDELDEDGNDEISPTVNFKSEALKFLLVNYLHIWFQ